MKNSQSWHYSSSMVMERMSRGPVTVLVVGARKVGKTAFVRRYLEGTFLPEEESKLIKTYTRLIRTSDGSMQETEIVDLYAKSTIEEKDAKIQEADAVLVMYAVDKRNSLKKAIKICNRIYNLQGSEIPVILLGNKTDLKTGWRMSKKKRVKMVQKKFQCCHMEASAKARINVRPVFGALVEAARNKVLNDYLDEMKRKRSSISQKDLGNHMPPSRISRYAIQELAEEDTKRQRKHKESLVSAENSHLNGKEDKRRPSRISTSTVDSKSRCICTSIKCEDKWQDLDHSQPLQSHLEMSTSMSRRRSRVSLTDGIIRKTSWVSCSTTLTAEPSQPSNVEDSVRKLSRVSLFAGSGKTESYTGFLKASDHFPLQQCDTEGVMPKDASVMLRDENIRHNSDRRRRKQGLFSPKPLYTCRVIALDQSVEAIKAAREECLLNPMLFKKRKGCIVM